MEKHSTKGILFARVSSAEQKESGYSLPSQVKLLTEYADRKGIEIVKKYSISETASKRDQRKTFDKMLKYVTKNDIKVLMFEKVDRVTRNLKDSVKIQDWLEGDAKRQVHCVKDSLILHRDSKSQEKLNWDLRVAISKNFADNLSEEVRKGYKQKIAQKMYPGRSKIGYKSLGKGPTREIIFDEDTAPLVKQILEEFSTGNYSAKTLMNKANDLGLRNSFGRKVSKTAVYRYLKDPFYYGYFLWNDKLYEGSHPPLISKETYDRNQEVLERGSYPHFNKHTYALKGIVKCGECKKMITWYEKKGRVYGECNTKDLPGDQCTQKKCGREDRYMKELIEVLKTFQIYDERLIDAIREELKKENKEQSEVERLTLEEAQARIKRIRSMLDTAYEDRLNEVINMTRYQELEERYSKEQEELEQKVNRIKKYSDKQKDIGLAIFNLSQNGEEIFDKANDKQKRELLNVMFSDLYLMKGKLEYKIDPAFKIVHEKVLETNEQLLQSSGVVEIREVKSEKPEPQKEVVVIDEKGYEKLTSSIWRRGWDSNPR